MLLLTNLHMDKSSEDKQFRKWMDVLCDLEAAGVTSHSPMTMVVFALVHYMVMSSVDSQRDELCQPGSRFEAPNTRCRIV